MAAKMLTAKGIKNEKPGSTRVEIKDAGSKGLYLVVQPLPGGSKAWAVRFRVDGKSTKLTLGRADAVPGALSLAEARKAAAEALLQLEKGHDPAAPKRIARATALPNAEQEDSVEVLVAAYVERYCKRKQKSWRETEAIFRREVLPVWKGRRVGDITRRNVIELLEHIAIEKGHGITANRTHGVVRRWMWWMADRGIISVNPALGIEPQVSEQKRKHVLNDDEVVSLWHAADKLNPPNDAYIKLLLLLGQRRCEVSGMRWSELSDLDSDQPLWTIDATRVKNKKQHTVPLPRQVVDIIKQTKRIYKSDYVLTTTGTVPICNFFEIKKRLDKMMPGVRAWRLHDLRRSCATGLQKLGVRLEITESVLNHRHEKLSAVGEVYQTFDYAPQKRQALQAWADRVDELVTGKAPNTNVADLAAVKAKRAARGRTAEAVR